MYLPRVVSSALQLHEAIVIQIYCCYCDSHSQLQQAFDRAQGMDQDSMVQWQDAWVMVTLADCFSMPGFLDGGLCHVYYNGLRQAHRNLNWARHVSELGRKRVSVSL